MTFSVLRALHVIIGEALDDIEAVYALHGTQDKSPSGLAMGRDQAPPPDSPVYYSPHGGHYGPNHRPTVSVNSMSNVYASPPPSPCIKTENSSESLSVSSLDFPSLDAPCNPTSLSEALTQHPEVVSAVNRIISACGQITATVQTPFLTLCDAVMGYHLPSCMRLLEASHTPEILREAGPTGLHVDCISEKSGVDRVKLAHILRLLATHHIVRELSPDVFSLNRISSTIDTGKNVNDLHQWTMDGIPEKKYENTSGVAAFVGLCSDEIFKSSAYLTETYLLSPSRITRAGFEPTRAPFCFAFGTVESKTGFFGWLEGSAESQLPMIEDTNKARVETGRGALYAPVKGGNLTSNTLKVPGPALARETPNANRYRLERFGKAMSGTCSWEAPGAILNSFEWHTLPRGSVIVDIGGGIGSTSMLLASAFSASKDDNPGLRFVIQDRPIVVDMGEKAWKAKCPEFLENGTALFQVHDFFAPQPVKQAAVFLLRVVLHDWPDDFARCILLHLREAAMPTTKLLLGDFILPLACPDETGGDEVLQDIQGIEAMLAPPPLLPNLGKASANAYWMDLTMQVMFNAQERTLREITTLAASAGWKVARVTKCSSSLFGYITAVPSDIPCQTQYPPTGASSYRDPAFMISKSSRGTGDAMSSDNHISQRYYKRDERELIERSSSRCGTPTFGSRMQLSLVEEALSKFGGGIFRSRKPGTGTRTTGSSKSSSLKQAIALTPAPSAKKKSSPLSAPSLENPPSPASPTPKVLTSPKQSSSRLSQKILPRRLSLANLRIPSNNNHGQPPLPSPRAPPSPMSPPHPFSRRSSLAQLPIPDDHQDISPLIGGPTCPALISTGLAPDPSLSVAPRSRKSSEHGRVIPAPMPPSPSVIRHRGSEDQRSYFQIPVWNASSKIEQQLQTRTMARRSSSAQIPIPSASHKTVGSTSLQAEAKIEPRKRTKSVAGLSSRANQHATSAAAFVSELGASLTNSLESRVSAGSSRLGGLLSRSGGGTGLRFEKGRDVAISGGLSEFSSLADVNLDAPRRESDQDREVQGGAGYENGPGSVLAAAARIEKRVLRRRESP